MLEFLFWLVIVVFGLVLFFKLAKNKNSFIHYFSRSQYMKELSNNKSNKKNEHQ
jgi:hypothetical protein